MDNQRPLAADGDFGSDVRGGDVGSNPAATAARKALRDASKHAFDKAVEMMAQSEQCMCFSDRLARSAGQLDDEGAIKFAKDLKAIVPDWFPS